jgi:hypothetical protein
LSTSHSQGRKVLTNTSMMPLNPSPRCPQPTAHVCPKRPCSFKSRPLAIGSRTLWPSSENISSQRLYLSRLEPF